MECDCRIGCRRNLSLEIILKYLFVFIAITSTKLDLVYTFYFDCDPVSSAHKCWCNVGDESGWEIQCPLDSIPSLPVAPISLKVLGYNRNNEEAMLRVNCDPERQNFPWDLIGGLDLGKEDLGLRVTKLEINYCSPLAVTDGFQGFLRHVNVSTDTIRSLSFVSQINYTISLPSDFLSLMTNIEEVNLRSNNLTTMPNFNGLTKLKSLNLRTNQLVSIPRNVFATNKNLESIALSGNKLTKIEKGSFPDSTLFLDLQNNKISTLTFESFANLKNLQRLFLDKNPLDNLETNTFNELTELLELSLRSNSFKEFPLLENLPRLTNLSITYITFPAQALNDNTRYTTTNFPESENGDISTPSSTAQTSILSEYKLAVVIRNLPSLSNLNLMRIALTELPVLENLPNLTTLSLAQNEIWVVSDKYFSTFPKLTSVDLSKNSISELTQIRAYNLTYLDLSRNKIRTLDKAAFQRMSQLKSLKMSHNQIEYIDPKAFEPLTELENLDLSNNNISFNSKSPRLTGNAEISDLDIFGDTNSYSPFKYCLKLQNLYLSNNLIDGIYEDWKTTMVSLTNINLSHNKLTALHPVDINLISPNIILDLTNNEISKMVNMEQANIYLEQEVNDEKVITVKLNGNPLNCDCNSYYLKTFSVKSYDLQFKNLYCNEPSNLFKHKLINVPDKEFVCRMTKECPDECDCWQRPADKTVVIDCSDRNLNNALLPEISNASISKEFRGFNGWQFELDLSGNGITELNETYATSLSQQVRFINLTGNNLTSISFLRVLNETTFALENNPFNCEDCSSTGFQTQWRIYGSRRITDINKMTCVSSKDPDNLKLLYLGNLSDIEDVCPPVLTSELRGLVIAVGILTGILVILVGVYIRHGWAIRAFLYSKGLGCCLWENGMEDDEEKIYDAFVSYSHKDEDWVLTELVNRLEEKQGFKLCLHFRDWTPGDWIPDQIVRSVDKSRRTVVVLSKNFVESVWSRLEFKAAHSQALSQRSNRLILILMGDDLKDNDVKDDDLRLYMKMNTYLKWNDPWFWHKLKYALPHKKSPVEENRNVLLKREQRDRAIKLDKLRAKLEQNV